MNLTVKRKDIKTHVVWTHQINSNPLKANQNWYVFKLGYSINNQNMNWVKKDGVHFSFCVNYKWTDTWSQIK